MVFNPYFQLGISAVLVSVAEVCLKMGAVTDFDGPAAADLFNITALASLATWVGIVFYVFSFVIWLYVLRLMPLTEAYALINVVHILVPGAAFIFLHESISSRRAIGIVLVFVGTLLVAAPTAAAEENL